MNKKILPAIYLACVCTVFPATTPAAPQYETKVVNQGKGWAVREITSGPQAGRFLWKASDGSGGMQPDEKSATKAAKKAAREARREARQERRAERKADRQARRENGVMAGPCGEGQAPDGPDGLCGDMRAGGISGPRGENLRMESEAGGTR